MFLKKVSGLQRFSPVILNRNFLSEMASKNPVETAIRQGIESQLAPIHLDIVNESYQHNVPPGSETHFKLLVVSAKFDGLPPIKRHRLVNDVVRESLGGEFVHALSLETKTPGQWSPEEKVSPSPKCLGGFGR